MSSNRKVSVRNADGEIVARVEYNDDLDFWDGRNNTCGETGRHKGITRLKSGEYVIIRGTQWQGERDSAEIVDAETALQAIMDSENIELLKMKKFAELKKMYEEKYDNAEMEEEA